MRGYLKRLRNRLQQWRARVKPPQRALVGEILAAGPPNSANPWIGALQALRTDDVFVKPDAEASAVCDRIIAAYRAEIESYGVPFKQFFGGSIKNEEAHALYAMVRARAPERVYQIGTFVGYSAMIIAQALKDAGGTGRLVAVDPEIPHRTNINPVDIARSAAVRLGLGDVITFERGWHSAPLADTLDPEWARTIPVRGPELMQAYDTQKLDFAFIDGDHSSCMTITDFMSIKDALAVDGVAVFHDVKSWPTVAQALHVIWTDILYMKGGTPKYFALDVRPGFDGLASLRRTRREARPTLKISVMDQNGVACARAQVTIAARDWSRIAGDDGCVFMFQESDAEVEVTARSGALRGSAPVPRATNGGFVDMTITLA